MKKLLLENVRLGEDTVNILIKNDVIDKIGERVYKSDSVLDCENYLVMPGAIDPHVHMRDLEQSGKEDWISGSKAAIRGGITTVFDMPNNNPAIVNREALELKRKAASKGKIDYLLYLGATNKNSEELKRILDEEPEDIAGIKVFLASSSSNEILDDVKGLRKIFDLGRVYNKIITVHTELQKFIAPKYKYPQKIEYHNIIRGRDAAITGLEIVLNLTRSIGNKIYIAHVSTREEMDMIRKEKAVGTKVYCEVAPHHLLLNETICKRMGNFAKVNPPLRTEDDNLALWEGINDYTVDTIGSDHAPHLLKEKQKAYSTAPSGFPGLETTLPLMLTCLNDGKVTEGRLVDLLCRKTAYIFGMTDRGSIKEGFRANLTIIDRNKKNTISGIRNFSKAHYTPFEGRRTVGEVVYTVIGGKLFKSDERSIIG